MQLTQKHNTACAVVYRKIGHFPCLPKGHQRCRSQKLSQRGESVAWQWAVGDLGGHGVALTGRGRVDLTWAQGCVGQPPVSPHDGGDGEWEWEWGMVLKSRPNAQGVLRRVGVHLFLG